MSIRGSPRRTACPVAFTFSFSIQPSNFVLTTESCRSSACTVPTDWMVRASARISTGFAAHTQLLNAIRAYFYDTAVIRLIALIDGDVIHPHRILFRHGEVSGCPIGLR